MRERHAAMPSWIGKCRRRTRTTASAGRRSRADRDARPRVAFRRDLPARCIPGAFPSVPTWDRTVRRCRGSRVPNLGENGRNLCRVSANCVKTNAVSADLRPLPSSTAGSRSADRRPRRSHQLRPRGPAGHYGKGRTTDSGSPTPAQITRHLRSDLPDLRPETTPPLLSACLWVCGFGTFRTRRIPLH